jgi:hypothetical protein
MADLTVGMFNPSDLISLGGAWVIQEDNVTVQNGRSQGLAANGDEAAYKSYGGDSSGTLVFECQAETGTLVIPNAGAVMGGYMIDKSDLVYRDLLFPRLTVTVHKHVANPHADGDMNEYACTVALPAQWGVPRSLEDVDEEDVFAFTDANTGIKSLTYSLGCTHQDESVDGAHMAGQSRDGVETLAAEWIEPPATVTVAAPWVSLNAGAKHGNTEAASASQSWERHVAREVEA